MYGVVFMIDEGSISYCLLLGFIPCLCQTQGLTFCTGSQNLKWPWIMH